MRLPTRIPGKMEVQAQTPVPELRSTFGTTLRVRSVQFRYVPVAKSTKLDALLSVPDVDIAKKVT